MVTLVSGFGRRVGERDGVSRRACGTAALEECDARVAVQAGGKADGAGAAVEKVRGDRLRDGAATGGDLMQIEVLQAVLKQQFDVAILDLLAGGYVGEVDQGAIEFQDGGYEDVLYAPLRGDWLISEVLGGLRAVALDMAAAARRGSAGSRRAPRADRFRPSSAQ